MVTPSPTLIDQNVNFLIIKGNFHAFVLWLIGTNTFGNMSIHAGNGTDKWKATHTERRQIIYYTVQIERFSTNLNNLHRCYVISHFSFFKILGLIIVFWQWNHCCITTVCLYSYRVSLMRNVTFYFLGLSIVGGRETPLGQHGAYITKVKKGSIADTVGHLRPGM